MACLGRRERALLAQGRFAPNARREPPLSPPEARARLSLVAVIAVLAWAAVVYAAYLIRLLK